MRLTRMEKSVARENRITKVLTIAILVRASSAIDAADAISIRVAFRVEDIVIQSEN